MLLFNINKENVFKDDQQALSDNLVLYRFKTRIKCLPEAMKGISAAYLDNIVGCWMIYCM